MKDNHWKKRLGMVYSTNPDFAFTTDDDTNDEPIATLPPERQRLRLQLEKSGRAGKTVTVIKGFVGSDDDLRTLSRELKKRLCTGGAEKDGQILIQGDVRQRLLPLLRTLGYTDSK